MMVKTGDRIRVDGAEATVTARHAAGKHTRYTLSDGRVMHDLQKRDDVEVLAPEPKKLEPKRSWRVPSVETGTVEDVRDETTNGEDLLD